MLALKVGETRSKCAGGSSGQRLEVRRPRKQTIAGNAKAQITTGRAGGGAHEVGEEDKQGGSWGNGCKKRYNELGWRPKISKISLELKNGRMTNGQLAREPTERRPSIRLWPSAPRSRQNAFFATSVLEPFTASCFLVFGTFPNEATRQ